MMGICEQRLRALTWRDQAVLAGRGAAAIWAALKAWGCEGREVLIPANTCAIVLWAVLRSGCRPRLIDIADPLHPSTLDALPADTSHAAAIIPAHLYGLPAPMDEVCAWARQRGLYVIEDAALALGGQVRGRPAGGWGDAAMLSFGLGKVVDHQLGGALVTDDPALAREVRRLLDNAPPLDDDLLRLANQWNGLYWPLHQYESSTPGLLDLYPRLFDLYGGITVYQLAAPDWVGLAERLDALPAERRRRQRLAERCDAALAGLPFTPFQRPAEAVLWKYPVLVEPAQRDNLLEALWAAGQHEVTRWYPSLRPMARALAPDVNQPPTPQADRLGAMIVNLPLHPGVEAVQVEAICAVMRQACG
jgi:dTDP-4-amino-4,6-dideoxygalactose transaminase